MLRDVASMRAITSLLVFLGVCAAGFSPRTSPQKVPNTSTNYHLADQLRSQVEFFSHIMHTGGTAWSKWVQHVYGVDTVAPGSATAAPLYSGQKAPYAPQFDILRDAIEECNANASCQAPKYRVAFGTSGALCDWGRTFSGQRSPSIRCCVNYRPFHPRLSSAARPASSFNICCNNPARSH